MKVIYDRDARRNAKRIRRYESHRYHVEQREIDSTWYVVGVHHHALTARLQAWWWAHTDLYGRNVRITDTREDA